MGNDEMVVYSSACCALSTPEGRPVVVVLLRLTRRLSGQSLTCNQLPTVHTQVLVLYYDILSQTRGVLTVVVNTVHSVVSCTPTVKLLTMMPLVLVVTPGIRMCW